MVQPKMRVLTAHLPVDLAEKIDGVADRMERSRGWIIKQALMVWLEQEEDKDRLTREAMMDVREGHVVSHENLRAWANSLSSDNPLELPKK